MITFKILSIGITMQNRIIYIDSIKAVLMLLVIWGHVIQYTNKSKYGEILLLGEISTCKCV